MREASEHVVRFGGSGGHPSDDDDDADAAAVAAFLRFAYAGSFPDSAPAAETLALCLRFRAAAATEAVTRALADAAERDASDAARLLALAPAFGVDAFDEDGDVAADAVDADADAAISPRAAFDGPLLLTRLFSRCARSLARNVADADPDLLAGVSADAFAATVGRDDLGVADEDEALALAQAWVSAKRRSPAETLTVAASVRWPQTSAAAARNARDAFRRASGGVTLLSPRLEALFAEAPTLSGARLSARADDVPGLDDATTEKDAVFFSSPASPTSSPLAVATDGASVSLSASDERQELVPRRRAPPRAARAVRDAADVSARRRFQRRFPARREPRRKVAFSKPGVVRDVRGPSGERAARAERRRERRQKLHRARAHRRHRVLALVPAHQPGAGDVRRVRARQLRRAAAQERKRFRRVLLRTARRKL
jgi:hypothetical protein